MAATYRRSATVDPKPTNSAGRNPLRRPRRMISNLTGPKRAAIDNLSRTPLQDGVQESIRNSPSHLRAGFAHLEIAKEGLSNAEGPCVLPTEWTSHPRLKRRRRNDREVGSIPSAPFQRRRTSREAGGGVHLRACQSTRLPG